MRIPLVVVLGVLGCARSAKPVETTLAATAPPPAAVADQPAVASAATAAIDPLAACKRTLELKAQHCTGFDQLPFTDPQECAKELAPELDAPEIQAFFGCVMQPSCEEVTNCIQAVGEQLRAQDDDATPDLRACGDDATSGLPVGVSPSAFAARNGATAKRFSDVTSTKDLPVEMCGIQAENEWLITLRCDDGSLPLKNRIDAERVRRGNLGPGGRCGSIIDLYRPVCGAKTYDIYIDAYVCPKQ
jgi:hypothetical protein